MQSSPRLLLALAATASFTACLFGSRPDALRRLAVLHAPETFAAATRIEVIVMGPDGQKRDANGEIARGGTTRALCESLLHSLAYRGCEASKEDATQSAEPLVRAMQQYVLLPEGWHFVSVRNVRVGDAPDVDLVLTIEAVE